jgi:hypothetical protein
MQPADIHGHRLENKCSALPDQLIPPRRKLIEELLMAIDGTGRLRQDVQRFFSVTPS